MGDAGVDGFGACVTQSEVDDQINDQGEPPYFLGFCPNPFGIFGCALVCPNPAMNPGDSVCSPTCVCAPLPPICP